MKEYLDFLKSFLDELRGEDKKIEHVHVAKIGCIRFEAPQKDEITPRGEPTEISASKPSSNNDKFWPDLEKNIIPAMQKCPHIFETNIVAKDKLGYSQLVPWARIFVDEKVARFHFKIPVKHQKRALFRSKFKNLKPIENFYVLTNGSLFLAYAEIFDFPFLSNIGQEYRELVKSQIEAETDFKCPSFGPVPMHPDFFFISCSSKENDNLSNSIVCKNDNIYFILFNEETTIHNQTASFFDSINSEIYDFYSLESTEDYIAKLESKTYRSFIDLNNIILKIYDTSWWNFINLRRYVNKGNRIITDIMSDRVELEIYATRLVESREKFTNKISKSPIFSKLKNYFMDIIKCDSAILPSFSLAIDHFKSVITSVNSKYIIIFSTLLAAVVGALVSGIITYYAGQGPQHNTQTKDYSSTEVIPLQGN